MSDLIDDPRDGENAHEFTVSEISVAVKRSLEAEFGRIRVKGEVGRVVLARSGHMYFDVKDDRNSLACTTWKGQVQKLSVLPEEGLEVVVTGKMTAFGGQSKYNLNVDDVTVAGVGALMAMLEKRKTVLEAEGLFDRTRKYPLPFLPEVIGVVTSPTGAVIRDILHRLRDRFPRKVLVWPVAVQGSNCAYEVASAIEGFNALKREGVLPRPDLIIVARGGGSIEDLWGFNEEIVARAASASIIPLISAIGHETDTTLIDFVSDMRAPTPTAAAELAVPVRLELLAEINSMNARAAQALVNIMARHRQRLVDVARALPRPENLITQPQQRLDIWEGRLPLALRSLMQRQQLRLREAAAQIRPSSVSQLLKNESRQMQMMGNRLQPALVRQITSATQTLNIAVASLRAAPLVDRTKRLRKDLNNSSLDLRKNFDRLIMELRSLLGAADRLRETLGYRETLKRGYAVVRSDALLITGVADAKLAKILEIEFIDGHLPVSPTAILVDKKAKKSKPPEQGQLL